MECTNVRCSPLGVFKHTNFNLRNVGYQFNFPVRKNFLFERKFIRVLNLISDKRDMSTKRLRFMPRTLYAIRTSTRTYTLSLSLSPSHSRGIANANTTNVIPHEREKKRPLQFKMLV